MAVLMTKVFARFARKTRLADARLAKAAAEVAAGKFDADLGGHVYKQRVARQGEGKSGGFRTIILFRMEQDVFFAYGFAKNEKPNLSVKELKELRKLAEVLLGLSSGGIESAIAAGELVKVKDSGEAHEA